MIWRLLLLTLNLLLLMYMIGGRAWLIDQPTPAAVRPVQPTAPDDLTGWRRLPPDDLAGPLFAGSGIALTDQYPDDQDEEDDEIEDEEDEAADEQPGDPDFTLIGVIMGNDDGVALLAIEPYFEVQRVRVDHVVEGWRVASIGQRTVELRRGRSVKRLVLDQVLQ